MFGTPHRVDLAALCAAFGVPHAERPPRAAPPAASQALAPAAGLRLVEVRADRRTLRAGHARLRAAVQAAAAPADAPNARPRPLGP